MQSQDLVKQEAKAREELQTTVLQLRNTLNTLQEDISDTDNLLKGCVASVSS